MGWPNGGLEPSIKTNWYTDLRANRAVSLSFYISRAKIKKIVIATTRNGGTAKYASRDKASKPALLSYYWRKNNSSSKNRRGVGGGSRWQQKSRKCPQAKLLANKQEKTIHKQEFGLKPGLNLLVPTMEPSQISSTTFGHLTIITGTVLIRVPW